MHCLAAPNDMTEMYKSILIIQAQTLAARLTESQHARTWLRSAKHKPTRAPEPQKTENLWKRIFVQSTCESRRRQPYPKVSQPFAISIDLSISSITRMAVPRLNGSRRRIGTLYTVRLWHQRDTFKRPRVVPPPKSWWRSEFENSQVYAPLVGCNQIFYVVSQHARARRQATRDE